MFDPTRIGPLFRYRRTVVTFGTSLVGQLVISDPYRVAMLLVSTAQCYVTPFQEEFFNATVPYGVTINQNTLGAQITLASFGPIVQQAWFWNQNGQVAGNVLLCWEQLWQPPGIE